MVLSNARWACKVKPDITMMNVVNVVISWYEPSMVWGCGGKACFGLCCYGVTQNE